MLDHCRADVLEAHRRLVHLLPQVLHVGVSHAGHRHGPHRRPAHAALLGQVQHQQAEHLVLIDECAVLTDHANTVRVAIGGQANVGSLFADYPRQLVNVWPDWLGCDAGKRGVGEIADLGHLGRTA